MTTNCAPSGPENVHAVALVIGDRGVLIEGEAGSGKSLLALGLLVAHPNAALVADDRVLLEVRSGRLLASAPPALAGLAEARGYGPAALSAAQRAVIDLVVTLVEANEALRYGPDRTRRICGLDLPALVLGRRDQAAAAMAVAAKLGLRPFSAHPAPHGRGCGNMAAPG